MFNNDFHYPLNKNLDDIYDNYPEYSEKVIQWESEYYSSFDEEKFISLSREVEAESNLEKPLEHMVDKTEEEEYLEKLCVPDSFTTSVFDSI